MMMVLPQRFRHLSRAGSGGGLSLDIFPAATAISCFVIVLRRYGRAVPVAASVDNVSVESDLKYKERNRC